MVYVLSVVSKTDKPVSEQAILFIKLICFSDKLEIKPFLVSKSFGEIYKDLIQLLLIDSNNLNNCDFVAN